MAKTNKDTYLKQSKQNKKGWLEANGFSKFWDFIFPILLACISLALFVTEAILIFFHPVAAGVIFILLGLCFIFWIIWLMAKAKKGFWLQAGAKPFKPKIKITIGNKQEQENSFDSCQPKPVESTPAPKQENGSSQDFTLD